ncbi:hypothetical protein [Rhodococcoides corynebacterioides]|uniref:Lipoprotein n=1 Tax=Rhodococcoides corynebacterioides TaxID=53972 RepID=A0ABS7P5L7_9NOCA|nr:hypothetical protein [Rhodococcus corynebacterioides]MBY6367316.1 hypothetical protein [Rhodococcus corynebacterioides]MBY6408956.1 hypothetical protein [Rhodococcus corynebacterioides]
MIRRTVSRSAVPTRVGLALAATSLCVAACGSGGSDPAPADSSTTAPSSTTSTAATATTTVTSDQAETLCRDLEAQLSDWRTQGPTLGRGGLNILVQTWAAQYGLNAAVVQNRAIVDDATEETCGDVRSQAIDLLEIPDLATGLVGL